MQNTLDLCLNSDNLQSFPSMLEWHKECRIHIKLEAFPKSKMALKNSLIYISFDQKDCTSLEAMFISMY